MVNITMTKTTQITRVLFACPQAADRTLGLGVRGGSYASMNQAPAFKDVAHLRSWRPPV